MPKETEVGKRMSKLEPVIKNKEPNVLLKNKKMNYIPWTLITCLLKCKRLNRWTK